MDIEWQPCTITAKNDVRKVSKIISLFNRQENHLHFVDELRAMNCKIKNLNRCTG